VPNAEIPPAVVRFVRDNIESLEQFELLTLLMKSPDRWWDAPSAAEALGISTAAARQTLERFATRNLLAITLTTDVRYQFQPGEARLRETVEALADAYRRDPIAIVRLVTDIQRRAMRDFADAFRIRRDDDR
jgi:hypothetical protein